MKTFLPSGTVSIFLMASATDRIEALMIFFLRAVNSFSCWTHFLQDHRKAKERMELMIIIYSTGTK